LTASIINQREDLDGKDMGSIFVSQNNPWSLGISLTSNPNQTVAGESYDQGSSIFYTKTDFDSIGQRQPKQDIFV